MNADVDKISENFRKENPDHHLKVQQGAWNKTQPHINGTTVNGSYMFIIKNCNIALLYNKIDPHNNYTFKKMDSIE